MSEVRDLPNNAAEMDAVLYAMARSDCAGFVPRLRATVKHLSAALVFADGMAVSETGHCLADLYAEDAEPIQRALTLAGCHPRGSIKTRTHHLSTSGHNCSCGWEGDHGQVHIHDVLNAKWALP